MRIEYKSVMVLATATFSHLVLFPLIRAVEMLFASPEGDSFLFCSAIIYLYMCVWCGGGVGQKSMPNVFLSYCPS